MNDEKKQINDQIEELQKQYLDQKTAILDLKNMIETKKKELRNNLNK